MMRVRMEIIDKDTKSLFPIDLVSTTKELVSRKNSEVLQKTLGIPTAGIASTSPFLGRKKTKKKRRDYEEG